MGAARGDRTSAATHCNCGGAQSIDAYTDADKDYRSHSTQVPDIDHDAVADNDPHCHSDRDDEPKVHGNSEQNTVADEYCCCISNGYLDRVVHRDTPSNTHEVTQQYRNTNEYKYRYCDNRSQQRHPYCDGNDTAAVAHSDPDKHGTPDADSASAGHQKHAV